MANTRERLERLDLWKRELAAAQYIKISQRGNKKEAIIDGLIAFLSFGVIGLANVICRLIS